MVKAHIITLVAVARKKPVKDIPYVSSTLGQFAKAKIEGTDIFYCNNAKEFAKDIRKKEKGSFDRWGRPTALGQQKRKEELAKLKLPETATLKEVVTKQFEARTKRCAQKLAKIANLPRI